jgi:hypothetical protein
MVDRHLGIDVAKSSVYLDEILGHNLIHTPQTQE